MAEWRKIKAEYIRGETSYRKLADKYKVSFSTLRKRAASEKWRELRDKTGAKTDTKITEVESDRKVDRMKRILDANDKLLDIVDKALQDMIDGVEEVSLSNLRQLAGTIKSIKDTQTAGSEETADRQVEIVFVPLEGETEDLAE
ncbi:hypothetical protein IMSAG013_01145 [Clostridiales bacterium]|nr:hypothetical protein IMSAG013_01145 [Clostridiales bacterium]